MSLLSSLPLGVFGWLIRAMPSRLFVAKVLGVLLLVLPIVGTACDGDDGDVRETPVPHLGEPLPNSDLESFMDRVRESGVISPDLIDWESASGLRFEGDDYYSLIGAVTREEVYDDSIDGSTVAILFVDERATEAIVVDEEAREAIDVAGLYRVNFVESESGPILLLLDEDDQAIEPSEGRVLSPEEFDLGSEDRRFFYTEGTIRCNGCLFGQCWCINCWP